MKYAFYVALLWLIALFAVVLVVSEARGEHIDAGSRLICTEADDAMEMAEAFKNGEHGAIMARSYTDAEFYCYINPTAIGPIKEIELFYEYTDPVRGPAALLTGMAPSNIDGDGGTKKIWFFVLRPLMLQLLHGSDA